MAELTIADWLGFSGVSLILLAYFLNLKGRLEPEDLSYILFNFIGSILACLASILLHYMPFVILEGVWFLVSLSALIRYFRRRKNNFIIQ